MMHKQPFNYLILLMGAAIVLASTLSGCREHGDPCPMGRQDHPLGNSEKSFMIYQGTENLVFIDLKHNRDTLRFKGDGIETGIDTSFIKTNDNMDYPCIDTTFFECQKIKFVNERNNMDIIEYKISKRVDENYIRSYAIVTGTISQYTLSLASWSRDSLLIDSAMYYNVYFLQDSYKENDIIFNKEFGLITYKDHNRHLILKAVKP